MAEGFVFADEAEAQAACEWWQKALGLAHWIVRVKILRADDMSMKDACGTCNYKRGPLQAVIQLVDPIDATWDTESWPLNHEKTLIHELLHLSFANFAAEDGTPSDLCQEQSGHSLARALVSLRRLAYPEPPWRIANVP